MNHNLFVLIHHLLTTVPVHLHLVAVAVADLVVAEDHLVVVEEDKKIEL
jgi:hypothetical protein